jgi:glycosyltransferase involved in cell wall biosynthesis
MVRVVVVVPALNEAATVGAVVRQCRAASDAVVLVDGGSGDGTVERAREGAADAVVVVEPRRGKGLAVRRGVAEAAVLGADRVVLIDADGERDPADIPGLLAALEREGADVAIGTRPRRAQRSRSRARLNRFANLCLRAATGFPFEDALSGFYAFRAPALARLALRSEGFELETELALESVRAGLRIVQVPVAVPLIARTHLTDDHVVAISAFFDRWVLAWAASPDCPLPLWRRLALQALRLGWVFRLLVRASKTFRTASL